MNTHIVVYRDRHSGVPYAIGPFAAQERAYEAADVARHHANSVEVVRMTSWKDFRSFFGVDTPTEPTEGRHG